MNFRFIRKAIVITAIAVAVVVPVGQLIADNGASASVMPTQESGTKIDQNYLINAVTEIQKQDKTIKIASSEEIKFDNALLSKVFVNCEDGVALVYVNPQDDSEWVGKVYETTSVKIVEKGDVWSKIQSGNVVGYVKTDKLVLGKEAIKKAKSILMTEYPEIDILTLSLEEIDAIFSIGETKQEETNRFAAEEAARIAAEKAVSLAKGQEIVAYAKQFIGNPYVWGGTSLTRGADCSGFVQSIYKHFGVSLPRTSYSMERVGREVSYSEIQPGDIVCYNGHVGIYAGDGKLVNAIDEQSGIGISNATHKKIITIRRIF